MTIGLTFPVLNPKEGEPKSVPWSLLEPHRSQAMKNHYQSLEGLAGRGGLSIVELAHVIAGRDFDERSPMSREDALKIVTAHRRDRGEQKQEAPRADDVET